MTSLKTPLRYPGGKSRAVKKMAEFFPLFSDYKEFREPFLGGGSVALYVSQMYPHLDIWVNDLYEPLYTFWKQLQLNGNEIKNQLVQLKQRHPDPASAKYLFLESKEYLGKDPEARDPTAPLSLSILLTSALFLVSLSPPRSASRRQTQTLVCEESEKLPYYQQLIKKWQITNLSYEQLLTDEKDIFVYLDPPYDIKSSLYGRKGNMHRGFDHDKFYYDCDKFKCDQMVSYNSSNLIKSRFIDWKPYEYDHTYTMRSVGEYMQEQQQRKELLLLNYVV